MPKNLQEFLGLDTEQKEGQWEELRSYMGAKMYKLIDVSPNALPPMHQESLDTLVNLIVDEKPGYFSGDDGKVALRKYLIHRIMSEQADGRRKLAKNGNRPQVRFATGQAPSPPTAERHNVPSHVGQPTGTRTNTISRMQHPYTSTWSRERRAQAVQDNMATRTNDESSRSRMHDSSGGSSLPSQSRGVGNPIVRPHQSVQTSGGGLTSNSSTSRPPPPPAPSPHPIQRPVGSSQAGAPDDPELRDFLTSRTQYAVPHLLPDLVAYGCHDMMSLKHIAMWPRSMITSTMKDIQRRSTSTANSHLDWDVLIYAVWCLGGRREE
ncbi:hypothetical protein BDN72DRAFT_905274 [Pluteus cervinus]|uniref:Uncharacterized protein n=1 Tax=Pluteus cervinus TaxID=181527 RepID=A0ACD3A3X4_9AGAR|nr:hypothetical protein BDN72DRAFT_905274 [Pluteus cervinus]